MSKKLLNQIQSAEEVRAQAFKTFMEIDVNKNIRLAYKPLNRGYLSFLSHFTDFESEAVGKSKSSAGTETKAGQKKILAKHLGIVLGLTKDYATLSKNTNMKVLVNYSETKINKMIDGDLLPFILNLKDKVFTTALFTNVDFMEYGVTALEFGGLVTAAETFNETRGEVTEDDNDSSTSNDNMDAIIDLIHLDFQSMDKSVARLAEENPTFSSGYHKNKVVTILGIRHEGVKGVIRKNGAMQPEAFIAEVGTDKTTIAEKDASYALYMLPGEHTLQAKNANGDSQTKTVMVTHRNMLDVDFDLE